MMNCRPCRQGKHEECPDFGKPRMQSSCICQHVTSAKTIVITKEKSD